MAMMVTKAVVKAATMTTTTPRMTTMTTKIPHTMATMCWVAVETMVAMLRRKMVVETKKPPLQPGSEREAVAGKKKEVVGVTALRATTPTVYWLVCGPAPPTA
jgi:hypothetical protein